MSDGRKSEERLLTDSGHRLRVDRCPSTNTGHVDDWFEAALRRRSSLLFCFHRAGPDPEQKTTKSINMSTNQYAKTSRSQMTVLSPVLCIDPDGRWLRPKLRSAQLPNLTHLFYWVATALNPPVIEASSLKSLKTRDDHGHSLSAPSH